MEVSSDARFPICRVLLVGPTPPPYGGMAFQARLLEKMLVSDGHEVFFLPANPPLPQGFGWLGRVPGLRTVARAMAIWVRFWRAARHVDVVHVLAASWVYFFTVVYPAVLMGRMRGKRVVMNYRGGEAGEFFRQWGWAIKPAFQLADAITVPSDFLGEMIRNRFPVPVRIVPNILNNSEFRYRQRPRIQPKLLVTRHLEKIYDVESVLKALRPGPGAISRSVSMDCGHRQPAGAAPWAGLGLGPEKCAVSRVCGPRGPPKNLRSVRHPD